MQESTDLAYENVFAHSWSFARQQCQRWVDKYPDLYPMYTKDGKWLHGGETWTNWCEGFYPGILWLLHMKDGDEWSRNTAERYTGGLQDRKDDRRVHDLGFIFLNTYLRWYRLSGAEDLRRIVLDAGKTLALRFQAKGGYLCSFLGEPSLFIDIMMNVPIIYWAAREMDDARLRSVADRHCETTAKYLVRADGSCAHEGIFDVLTGKFLREGTQQGIAAQSRWSRGLAWALYGFGMTYWYTKNPLHLEVAERTARFYIDRTPGGKVPFWDFDVECYDTAERVYDSSTAAIASSGLWNLALLTPEAQKAEAYRKRAIETLFQLCSPEFLAAGKPDEEGILLHGVYHYHKRLGVDESVAWGDHFFVEALYKITTSAQTVEV